MKRTPSPSVPQVEVRLSWCGAVPVAVGGGVQDSPSDEIHRGGILAHAGEQPDDLCAFPIALGRARDVRERRAAPGGVLGFDLAAVEVGSARARVFGQLLGVLEEDDGPVGVGALEHRGHCAEAGGIWASDVQAHGLLGLGVAQIKRRRRGAGPKDAPAVLGDRVSPRPRARAEQV